MLRATEIIGVKLTGWRRIKGSAEEARITIGKTIASQGPGGGRMNTAAGTVCQEHKLAIGRSVLLSNFSL